MPTVAHVYQLPNPEDAEFNIIVVQDGQYNPDRTSSSVAASKYGSGGQYWAFEGHDRIYRGVIDNVYADHTGFTLATSVRGFVVNVGELLIAQSVYGAGAGQCRRIRYVGRNEFEEVDGQKFKIDTSSLIVLWKSNSSNRVAALLKPSVVTAQYVSDGSVKEFALPAVPNDANYVLPFVAGYPVTGYSLIENQTKIMLLS